MASLIFPEQFQEGDFHSWLLHFERCASANSWDATACLQILPAFLHGPAAMYFESLEEHQKNTYDNLVASLWTCFYPATYRERYYQEFASSRLWPTEDPVLFLWRLKESLLIAEPGLSTTAFDALLHRQFMNAMPPHLQSKLLAAHPTPSLEFMVSFCQKQRAVAALALDAPTDSRTRTISRARERFFWPQMQESIKAFIRNCPECSQTKDNPKLAKAPLRQIEVSEPFVFWAMDYMGPIKETDRGNKHILVLMDHFTKWCQAFPTKDQKASTVARILVSSVFSRCGPPTVLHSDQGRNFDSTLMYEIYQLMGIKKTRTTAYHPQCDGLVERQNRTLQNILGLIHTSNLCRVKSTAIESNTSATKMRRGFRRRICVRFNEVLSDTYTRHFIVKLVDTRGKWRNFFVEDTRATQGPLQKKGQEGKIYPKVTTDMISMS